MKNYYAILGIDKNSDIELIKKAYRNLALKYHPDKNKDYNASKKFIEITEAYEILKDPIKRREYDKKMIFEEHIVTEFETWKRNAQEKASRDAKMDYNLFSEKLLKELKLIKKHSVGIGCVILLVIMVITTLVAAIKILSSDIENKGFVLLSVAFWIGLLIFFYNRVSGAYKDDRNNL